MVATAERPHVTVIDYYPRGAARALFSHREPEILLCGPSGTGKSFAILQKLHLCLSKYTGMRGLLLRKTHASLTSTALVTYQRKVLHPLDGVRFFGGSAREAPQFIYPNGSRLMVGGMDNPTKIMSSEYDVIALNEATELAEEDWETATTRLRNNVMPYQQLIGDCNPDAPTHWLKRRCDRGQTVMLESRHEDNPELFHADGSLTEQGAAYIAKLDALTGVRYYRYRLGTWAAAEGLVYEEYDTAIHVITQDTLLARGLLVKDAANRAKINRDKVRRVVAGVDWGYTNPGVIQVWLVDSDGRIYRVHEVYQTGRLIGWWVERGKALKAQYGIEAFVCDPSEPAYIRQFNDAGLRAVLAVNDIAPGIQAVKSRLAVQADGLARLYLVAGALEAMDPTLDEAKRPTCTDEELAAYVWPKGADGKPVKEVPVDDANHGCDAVRYTVMYVDAGPGTVTIGSNVFY